MAKLPETITLAYDLTPYPVGIPVSPTHRILADRNATVAEVTLHRGGYFGETIRVTGSSKRAPGDPHNPALGEALALSRAYAALAEKLAEAL
ncbi:dsRBD fold-containing protein [Uniformispora flossi]|uniref:dsRBD fold-containing protein n=1 Tax=Uniformispora flossi TaxID=3390723 RepID=UPI003C2E4C7A